MEPGTEQSEASHEAQADPLLPDVWSLKWVLVSRSSGVVQRAEFVVAHRVVQVFDELCSQLFGGFDSCIWAESEHDGHGVEQVNELQCHETPPFPVIRPGFVGGSRVTDGE